MYIEKDTVYSEPGCCLRYQNRIGYHFPADYEVVEEKIDFDKFTIKNNIVHYHNGLLVFLLNPEWNYDDYKRHIIKLRYSNDDQIAIMLNKDDSDDDLLKYNRMMEWRRFASFLAKRLINL